MEGLKVEKDEKKVYVKDKRHVMESSRRVSLESNEYFGQLAHAWREYAGTKNQIIQELVQSINGLIKIRTQMLDALKFHRNNLDDFEETFPSMWLQHGRKKIDNRLIGNKPMSKKEYEDNINKVKEASKRMDEEIKKQIERLKEEAEKLEI